MPKTAIISAVVLYLTTACWAVVKTGDKCDYTRGYECGNYRLVK